MLLLLVFFTSLIGVFVHLELSRRKLPKGPYPLPIVGNIPQLMYYLWKHGGTVDGYNAISKIYGKVFTIWLGPMPTVYIADYDVAYETHVKQSHLFSTRYTPGFMNHIRDGRGVIASNGVHWQEHRRFSLHTLRNFGLGRNLMEDKIMNELNWVFEDFEKFQKSKEVVVENSFFDLLVGSIINQLLVSKRFHRDDEKFEELKKNICYQTEKVGLLEVFTPLWIQKSWCLKWRQHRILSIRDSIHQYCVDQIQERVSEPLTNEEPDDYVGAYFERIEKDKDQTDESKFTLDTLSIDMMDLWIAGQETTATTLTWAGICLLNRPEIQKKARKELVDVTCGTRDLSLGDKKNTPYLNAVINEVQRIASILNVNLLRITTEDTSIDGQPLSAGTAFTTQLSMLHTDESVFKNHKEFRPERFLVDAQLEKRLIPFGIGKRACLGESLARAELYLILGNILLRYEMQSGDGKIPKIETISAFAMLKRPPSYKLKFLPLNE